MGCEQSKLESFGRNSQAYYSKLKRFENDPKACCSRVLKRYGKKISRKWVNSKTRSVDVQSNPRDDDEYDHHHGFDDDHGDDFSHDQRKCSFGVDMDVPMDGGHEHNILRHHTSLDKGKGIMTDDESPKPSWHRPNAEYFSHTCDKSQPNSYYHHPQPEGLFHDYSNNTSPLTTCHSKPHDFYHDSGRKVGFSNNAEPNQPYNNLYPPKHSSNHGATYNWVCHVPHNDYYCDHHHHRSQIPIPHTSHQSWNHHHHGSVKPQDFSWDDIFGRDAVDQFFRPSFYCY